MDMEHEIMEAQAMAWKAAYRIQRSTGTRLDVEELAAEGLLGLVQAASRYRPETGAWFKAFARRRVHGAIMDRVRADKDWTLCSLPDGWKETPSGVDGALTMLERKEAKSEVLRAVNNLPPGERRAIYGHYIEGKKQADIAAESGIDPTRVSQNKSAGLDRLRIRLSKLEER
tara:strand:+ start:358 stop:873 length:516 start_codon:yes stop_codon:yes gene_type:complete